MSLIKHGGHWERRGLGGHSSENGEFCLGQVELRLACMQVEVASGLLDI